MNWSEDRDGISSEDEMFGKSSSRLMEGSDSVRLLSLTDDVSQNRYKSVLDLSVYLMLTSFLLFDVA